jgi:CxxC motif-containing protein (DUF1111 family)
MNCSSTLRDVLTILAVTTCTLTVGAEQSTGDRSVPPMTTSIVSAEAYRQVLRAVDEDVAKRFEEGLLAFDRRWTVPFEHGLFWGRGPVSNGEGCSDCHFKNGRGKPPSNSDDPMRSMLVRLSVPGDDGHGGPKPDPNYGGQLNFQGVPRRVPGEGEAYVVWAEKPVAFPDGETIVLRTPRYEFKQLAFGPLNAEVMTSVRLAPALIGLGLLEAIPEEDVLALAKQNKPHGIRGKPNYVWDITAQRIVLGRFGLKANQPNLAQQTLTAFHQDLGVTSYMYPEENCIPIQSACKESPSGGQPELGSSHLSALLLFLRAAAPPAPRDIEDADVREGERLFREAACSICHVPELKTGAYDALPTASNKVIHPYTDLLVHDMGDALADGRPDYAASGSEWRTAPLWGLGLRQLVSEQTGLLHDGRARDIGEAILWHGGEAEWSRIQYIQMPRAQRAALVKFVSSL